MDIEHDTFTDATLVRDLGALYAYIGAATVADWSAVYDAVDDVEMIGPLTGWGTWTHAVRVTVGEVAVVYFVR